MKRDSRPNTTHHESTLYARLLTTLGQSRGLGCPEFPSGKRQQPARIGPAGVGAHRVGEQQQHLRVGRLVLAGRLHETQCAIATILGELRRPCVDRDPVAWADWNARTDQRLLGGECGARACDWLPRRRSDVRRRQTSADDEEKRVRDVSAPDGIYRRAKVSAHRSPVRTRSPVSSRCEQGGRFPMGGATNAPFRSSIDRFEGRVHYSRIPEIAPAVWPQHSGVPATTAQATAPPPCKTERDVTAPSGGPPTWPTQSTTRSPARRHFDCP